MFIVELNLTIIVVQSDRLWKQRSCVLTYLRLQFELIGPTLILSRSRLSHLCILDIQAYVAVNPRNT